MLNRNAAETLGYEFGVPLDWATESERPFAHWSAKSIAQYVLHLRGGGGGRANLTGLPVSKSEV